MLPDFKVMTADGAAKTLMGGLEFPHFAFCSGGRDQKGGVPGWIIQSF